MKTKEKLFKKQDVNQWRVSSDLYLQAERVKTDPVEAYKFILPDVRNTLIIDLDYIRGRGLKRGS